MCIDPFTIGVCRKVGSRAFTVNDALGNARSRYQYRVLTLAARHNGSLDDQLSSVMERREIGEDE